MRPNNTQMVHHVDKIDESMRMSIDSNSIAHLMQLLTDLYSDPILAVMREYSTNARDSHIDAGHEGPIIVTLPTALEPNFVVQDFGIGLNVDDLRDVYSMYGKSTKRDSDDATGTLGLGCKSGLTYALSFTVTAVKDGVKTVAAITKDTDGVGTIKILDTAGTDDPNGVTVSIPVKSWDVARFAQCARDFYRYWRSGTVLVDGKDPSEQPWDEGGLKGREILWLDDDVAVVSNHGAPKSHVVMGGVPYPFDSKINGVNIIAWIPMGSVNFTPSRESLHFTTLTESTLSTLREFVEERLVDAIKEAIDSAPTPYEKVCRAVKWWYHARGALRDHWAKTDSVELGENSAWQVHVSPGYKTKAERKDVVKLTDLVGNHHVITEFPYKSVSAAHKARLAQFGVSNALLLPKDSDVSFLEGKKECATWQKVFDSTEKPVIETSTRAKTQYMVRYKGRRYSTDEITETDAPIVYATPYSSSYHLTKFPDARCVEIKAQQVDRFKRLHPKAVHVDEHLKKEVAKLKKRLTEDDLLWAKMDRSRFSSLKGVASRIDDPMLQKAVRVANGVASPAMIRLGELNGVADVPVHESITTLASRYPLLYALYGVYGNNHKQDVVDDLIIYLNTKYQSIKDAE